MSSVIYIYLIIYCFLHNIVYTGFFCTKEYISYRFPRHLHGSSHPHLTSKCVFILRADIFSNDAQTCDCTPLHLHISTRPSACSRRFTWKVKSFLPAGFPPPSPHYHQPTNSTGVYLLAFCLRGHTYNQDASCRVSSARSVIGLSLMIHSCLCDAIM